MTNTARSLLGVFGTVDFLVPLVLDDITEADARARSRGDEGPSITWTIGHLLNSRHQLLELLGEGRDDPYGERFAEPATSGNDYPTLSELRREWERVSDEVGAALSQASEATFDAPASSGNHAEQTLRDKLAFIAFHEGYHMGVIGAIRKGLGKPGPAERVIAARS